MSNTSTDLHHVVVLYNNLREMIDEIDSKLDAGSDSARKRELVDSLVSSHSAEWAPVVEGLVPQMEEMSAEQLAANYFGIVRAIQDKFKKSVDDFVNERFEALPAVESNVSDAEKKALSEERSKLYQQIKAVITMAETFEVAEQLPDDPMPKRRGAVGKRGKRALSLYSWTIDGVELDEDDNDPKGVAAILGFEKPSKFTEYLKTLEVNGKKLNTTNPPDEFSFTYNGKDVVARRESEDETPEGDDDAAEVADDE